MILKCETVTCIWGPWLSSKVGIKRTILRSKTIIQDRRIIKKLNGLWWQERFQVEHLKRNSTRKDHYTVWRRVRTNDRHTDKRKITSVKMDALRISCSKVRESTTKVIQKRQLICQENDVWKRLHRLTMELVL